MQNLRPLILGIVGLALAAVVAGFFYVQQTATQTTAGTNITNAANQAGNAANYGATSNFGSGNLSTTSS